MKYIKLVFLILLLFCESKGTTQNIPWKNVELTPSLSSSSGKIEYVIQDELVFLSAGELFHVRYDENFNLNVLEIENQVTDVKDFHLIDVDWDGDKDIIAIINDGPIQVYENIDGTFIYNVKIEIFSWINVKSFSVHDVNTDGRSDILLNNILYISTGPTTFERTYTTHADNYIPISPQFFDYDLDGDKDLLTILVTNLFMHENTGTTSLPAYLVPDFSHRTSWAKVIRAGNKDVIIVFSESDKKFYRIFYENKTFGYKEIGSYTHTKPTSLVKAIDLDGDGIDEIISDQYINQLTILKYDTLADKLNIHNFSTPNFLDFAVGQGDELQVYVRYSGQIEGASWDKTQNKMIRKFLSPTVFTPSENHDIDGDGFVDLVKGFDVKRYLGERSFDNIVTLNIDSTGGQWLDFDDDGDLDYVLKYGWYRNIGGLLFDPYQTRSLGPVFVDPQIFFTNIVFREDLDEDGDIDVLTYNRFGEPFELYENANGNFSIKQVLATNSTISGFLKAVYFEDFDGDGKKDILIAVASGMAWMKNLGSLVFSEPKLLYNDSLSPLMADISDVNADGIMDVIMSTGEIITGKAIGSVILYLGSPDAKMQEIPIAQGNGYHYARFADLNRTGWKDIVFLKEEGLHTVILEGTNAPQISRISFNAGTNNNFQIRDLDGDRDDDIIATSTNGSIFYIINGDFISNSCPKGSVFLRNQEQVFDFVSKYGQCSVIPGDLFIGLAKNSSCDIRDISGLVNIQKIQGNLTIHHGILLNDFSGFMKLDTIEGSLILEKFSTKNLQGFDSLIYIGKNLELNHTAIGSLNYLLDTRELSNVRFVGGNIDLASGNFINLGIQSQPEYFGDITLSTITINALTNIDFLKNTTKIHGSLNLERCNVITLEPAKNLQAVEELIVRSEKLKTLGMGSKIDSIKGSLIITSSNQTELFSDSSFADLKYVGNKLELYAKSMKGFSKVEKVIGSLFVGGNTIDTGFMDKIYFVGKNLSIDGNEIYPNFLRKVDSIPGYISFLQTKFNNLAFLSSLKKAGSLDLNQNTEIFSLKDLDPDLELKGRLLIQYCPKLNFCDVPFVCTHIADGKEYYFKNNGLQCNDPLEFDCLSNAFSGKLFYDLNQNGTLDDNEFPVSGMKLTTINNPQVVYSGIDGKYNFHFLPDDSLNIGLIDATEFIITTTPERYAGRFTPEASTNKDNNFGIFHLYPKYDLNLSTQFGLFVCNRPVGLDVQLLNQGSFIEKTRIKVQLPSYIKLDSIEGVDYVYDQANSIVWIQTDTLKPFQRKKQTIFITAPGWNPNTDNKHLFTWEVQVLNSFGQWTSVSENEKIMELLCSYDPNDKLVEGPYKGSNLLFGQPDYLNYTIRFQNTGNYYAEHVMLADTLSPYLNLDSLVFITSSHKPIEMTRNGNILKFYFPHIMLPDSARDFAGSQGYVRFKIKTKYGIDPEDIINNTAHIYFDYNPAIKTNTVNSFILLPDFSEDYENLSILLKPQPAIDKMMVQIDGVGLTKNWTYSIYNQNGAFMFEITEHLSSYIDISGLSAGMYWLVFQNLLSGKKLAKGFIKI